MEESIVDRYRLTKVNIEFEQPDVEIVKICKGQVCEFKHFFATFHDKKSVDNFLSEVLKEKSRYDELEHILRKEELRKLFKHGAILHHTIEELSDYLWVDDIKYKVVTDGREVGEFTTFKLAEMEIIGRKYYATYFDEEIELFYNKVKQEEI